MIQTAKYTCRQVAAALAAFGVTDVVTSPGSRNAPLLMAVARRSDLRVHSVVDERSAAFIALGIAEISLKPVALICTSGSALLNYAPAISEAYYKKLPLIVISADRPSEWIDQADSQTIRQPGALSNIVKSSYSLKAEADSMSERHFVDRTLNEALIRGTSLPFGPVHINVAISEPLTIEADVAQESFRRINCHYPSLKIDTSEARKLADYLSEKRVLIVGGCNAPSSSLNKALSLLAHLPNVVVLSEGVANVKASGVIEIPDLLLAESHRSQVELPAPDVLITFGGALVSGILKKWLRSIRISEHWHIEMEHNVVDTFNQLTDSYIYPPELFFPRLANALAYIHRHKPIKNNFSDSWHNIASTAEGRANGLIDDANRQNRWNAVCAIQQILQHIPREWNIQLSNGTTVRFAQLLSLRRHHRIDCNRGVSGIDGSTSTAIGASVAYKGAATLLLTGDMSFIYDIGAIASNLISPRLKIVVFNNGGGGIFKMISPTAQLPETPQLLQCNLAVPVRQLAEAFGFIYHEANNYASLKQAIKVLQSADNRPYIVEVKTDADCDAAFYKNLIQ